MSDSHRLHLRTRHGGQRIEHRRHLVKWIFGMAGQPATNGTFLMLLASSGTKEVTWLSDTGAYGHCACQMWALFHLDPVYISLILVLTVAGTRLVASMEHSSRATKSSLRHLPQRRFLRATYLENGADECVLRLSRNTQCMSVSVSGTCQCSTRVFIQEISRPQVFR